VKLNITSPTSLRSSFLALLVSVLLATSAQAEVLNGVAVHEELKKELFIAGLYLPYPSKKPKDIFIMDGPMRMEMRITTKRFSPTKFTNIWRQGIVINNTPEDIEEFGTSMIKFYTLLKGKLVTGDIITITRDPGKTTTVSVNGVDIGTFDDDFFVILLKAWLGPRPASTDFKKGLLRLDSTLQSRFDGIQPLDGRRQAISSWGSGGASAAEQLAADRARRAEEAEARRQAEEEAQRKAEEEARLLAEKQAAAEAKARAEEEARLKAEEEARKLAQARAEAEAKAKAEEEARQKAEEEARKLAQARAEAEAKAKAEAERKAREAEEARQLALKTAADAEAKQKAEEAAKAAAEAKRKAEEEAKARAEAEAKAAEEARQREEAKRKAEEEARQRAIEEEKARKEAEARALAAAEAKAKAEEEAKARAEAEAKAKAEAEERARAAAEAEQKAKEEDEAAVAAAEAAGEDGEGGEGEEDGEAVELTEEEITAELYSSKLIALVNKWVEYPEVDRSRRKEGSISMKVVINREGEIVSSEMIEKSRYATLNFAAKKAISVAQPYPPIPEEIEGETFEFSVPILFRAY
jgi:TolA protein